MKKTKKPCPMLDATKECSTDGGPFMRSIEMICVGCANRSAMSTAVSRLVFVAEASLYAIDTFEKREAVRIAIQDVKREAGL